MQLIGEDNVGNITSQGNDLLNETYQLIQSNASEEDIKEQGWQPYAAAMQVVLEHEQEIGFSGNKFLGGSVHLWGGTLDGILLASPGDDPQPTDEKCKPYERCKWFQLGCHARNIGTWMCENPEHTATIITAVITGLVTLIVSH